MFADTGKSFNELNVLTSPGSKGSKFERGGHGMVYFSNATFQLAWTLGIYVWLVCSAKFPAKTISGQFCMRTVQFWYENYVFCVFSDTRCLDALFETKCFINLSCGYRNLTKSINDPNQLRLLKKYYILTDIYVNFSCFYENFKLPLAWETTWWI